MACNDTNIRTIILFICVPLCPSKQCPPCSHTLEFDEIQMLVIYGLGYLFVVCDARTEEMFQNRGEGAVEEGNYRVCEGLSEESPAGIY